LKGEDGNGVEYIYTVCKRLDWDPIETGGFTITKINGEYPKNKDGVTIEGSTSIID
jgi:hypothetical protein